jgi:ribonuclease D
LNTNTETSDALYIDTPEALSAYCEQISGCEWMCIDTEFLRERTYFPKLCLLQIATERVIACIDPLALQDMSALMEIIYDTSVLKILHAGRQDLEIFLQLNGSLPSPIFDTQLAAALLCDSEQIGYANLVQQLIGVQLKKDHTRTDWTRRPLNSGQLEYAADDVRYLREMYQMQRDTLVAQNKLDWLDDDFASLIDTNTYQLDPQTLWTRVKHHRKLKGKQLAILRELAAWREQRAIKQDRPRKWIIKDEPLLEIARFMPDSLDSLAKIRDIEDGHLKNIGKELLDCVSRGQAVDSADWPTLNKLFILTPEQDAVIDYLMAIVRLRALDRGLSPTTLASRKMLEAFLQDQENNPLCKGWRKTVIGIPLKQAMRGNLLLKLVDGNPQIEKVT